MMQNLIPDLLTLADQAGDTIMQIYHRYHNGSALEMQNKADDSPVTEADIAAHHIIAAGLQTLTPDIPIISEEDPSALPQRVSWPTYWLVDPLDGTKEFIKKNDEFTVNIALIHQHQPVIGVITAPALGIAYWGHVDNPLCPGESVAIKRAQGQHQPLHQQPIETRIINADEPAIALVSRSHPDPLVTTWMHAMNQQLPQPLQPTSRGSSLKLCAIAEGSADFYPKLNGTSEWDIAAGQAILTAAGGAISQRNQQPMTYGDRADVLNAPFLAHGYGSRANRRSDAINYGLTGAQMLDDVLSDKTAT